MQVYLRFNKLFIYNIFFSFSFIKNINSEKISRFLIQKTNHKYAYLYLNVNNEKNMKKVCNNKLKVAVIKFILFAVLTFLSIFSAEEEEDFYREREVTTAKVALAVAQMALLELAEWL